MLFSNNMLFSYNLI